GDDSYGIGNNNTINASKAFVLGNNVTVAAGLDGAVVLGDGSTVAKSTVASYNPGTGTVAGTATGSNVVSVGAAGSERRITNVAAGGALTDAVNVSQLTAAQTHYYSVNDGGAKGGNYANDGASGTNALAAGVGASAAGGSGVAIGDRANAAGSNSIALGVGSVAAAVSAQDNNIAIGTSARALLGGGVGIGFTANAAGTNA